MVADDFNQAEDERLIEEIAKCPEIYDPHHDGYKKAGLKDKQWAQIAQKLDKSVDQCKRRWKNHRDNFSKQKKLRKTTGKSRRKNIILQKMSFLEHVEPKNKWILAKNMEARSRVENVGGSLVPEVNLPSVAENENVHTLEMDTEDEAEARFEPAIHNIRSLEENQPMSESCSANDNDNDEPRDPLRDPHTDVIVGLLKRRDQENSQLLSQLTSLQNQHKNEDELDLFFRCITKTMRKLPPYAVCELKTKIFSLVSEQEMKVLQGAPRPDSRMSTNSDIGNS